MERMRGNTTWLIRLVFPILMVIPAATSALEIEPVGSEFQVNTYTLSNQTFSSIASTADGGYVVAWDDEGRFHIFGQRFDRWGSPIGTDFQISAYSGTDVALIGDGDGGFIAAWVGFVPPTSINLFGRFYDHNGDPRTEIFRVDIDSTVLPMDPALALNGQGDLLVSWTSQSGGGILAQRIATDGSRLGTEFQIQPIGGGSWSSALLALESDDFVAAWTSGAGRDGSQLGVFAQRIASSGILLGSEFQVNTFTSSHQVAPDIGPLSDGGFVVTWGSLGQDGAASGIFAQRFDEDTLPVGDEFQVNSYTLGAQNTPSIAADSEGGFLVAWEGDNVDGARSAIFARRLDENAVPVGVDFKVNSYTTDFKILPEVAGASAGSFVVTWTSETPFDVEVVGRDGDGAGIFAQRYAPLCGNGRLDPGEECDDGNAEAGDCCDPTCNAEPDGPASCDGNVCTREDTCSAGSCISGICAVGQPCTVCGGSCTQASEACECNF